MKRFLAAVLVLALLWAAACASADVGEVTDHIVSRGYSPEVSDNPDGTVRCDFHVLDDTRAALEWSDAGHTYAVSGDAAEIGRLCIDVLDRVRWDACRATVNGAAMLSYGTDSAERFDTLEQYVGQMKATLNVRSADAGDRGEVLSYVINTKSGRFHHPDCPGVKQMSDKNRRDYTGTREELIDQGYTPCGTCMP